MKIKWNGIEFGKDLKWYIYWCDIASNPKYRKLGTDHFWYKQPHKWYCFWWFNIGWSTPYTKRRKR